MTSERTPLLEQCAASPESAPLLPSLRRACDSLCSHQLITAKHLREVIPDEAAPTPVTDIYALLFAIPLYMELLGSAAHIQSHIPLTHDSYELMEELWTSYSASRLGNSASPRISSNLDIRELLWVPIVADDEGDDGPEFTSVADLLASLPRNSFLLEQPCISHAIELSWKYGPPQAPVVQPQSTLTATLQKLSANVSPRASHLLDAMIYTTYLACQAHVLITGLRDQFGRQDIWILVYSAYALLPFPLLPCRPPRPRRYFLPRRIGFILALLAYITPPNNRPKPETLAHVWLLLSFGWNVFRLILAPGMSPGWILVFPLRVFLLPALEFNRLLRPVVLQPFIYFLPLILLFGCMLTLSMDDPWTLQDYIPSPEGLSISVPAPYDTREALFVFLLLSLVLLFFFSVASLIRVAANPAFILPSTSASRSINSLDDALPPAAARIVLQHTLLYHGRYFPAPLSFIPFLLIRVPMLIIQRFQMCSTPNNWVFTMIENFLWWLLIWPPSFLLSGLWGWGCNAPREQ